MSAIDSVVFDVDGVLWDSQDAYNRCTVLVVERVCLSLGLPSPGVTLEDVAAFKLAGGFNNDMDLAWTLIVLAQARAHGNLAPDRTWQDLAVASDGQGMTWSRPYARADAPDWHELQRIYDAYYWGADRYPAIYDCAPVLNYRPGFAQAERPFACTDLMPDLRESGVRSAAIITGRNLNEMRTPLAGLNFDGLLNRDAIFTHEDGNKPDPQLLCRALARLDAGRAVMVGDSIDDLRTVLRYRELPAAERPADVFAIQIASPADAGFWYAAGADLALTTVNDLPAALTRS